MATKTEREKHEQDLRELQQRNVARRQAHAPAEVHVEVPASTAKGDGEKVVELHVFGGHAYLNSHGEARFDQDQLTTLIQKLQAAFQAVQV